MSWAWKRRPLAGETLSEVDVLRQVLKGERFPEKHPF